ncbi:hypothetical protein Hypma_009870 [Hypsizygus marmoreus]|uniref:Uncharacterized protein n=1 Tax=Hypsizygus marmoreus TaxID=39966 RepID=A0A369JPB3_HYPMA|nr:hypothetical protein Hypma_009870 [Hypsizygus marmoreus]
MFMDSSDQPYETGEMDSEGRNTETAHQTSPSTIARSKKASNATRKLNDVFWHATFPWQHHRERSPDARSLLDLISLLCNRYCSEAEKQNARRRLKMTIERYERFLQEANVVKLVIVTWNHSRRVTHSTIRGFDSDGFLSFTVHQDHNATRDEVFVYSRGGRWWRNLRRRQKLPSGAEVRRKYGCCMTNRSTFVESRFFEKPGLIIGEAHDPSFDLLADS